MASDLGLHCLPITLLGVSRLQWVNNRYKNLRKAEFGTGKWVLISGVVLIFGSPNNNFTLKELPYLEPCLMFPDAHFAKHHNFM